MLTAVVLHAGTHAVIIRLRPPDAGKIHIWIGNDMRGIVGTASALNDENRCFVAMLKNGLGMMSGNRIKDCGDRY